MIREATAADRPRLREIQSRALAEPWPELLATVGDGPVLSYVSDRDGPIAYALVVPGDEAAYLAELAVDPDRQGDGHGSALLAAVLDRLAERGFDRVRLTARADDDRVRSFYRDHGFAFVDRVPDHYESGDGVVLERRLSD